HRRRPRQHRSGRGPMVKLFPGARRRKVANAGGGGILPGGPDGVEVTGRHVRAGEDYAATLAVTGYPAEVGAGWLEPILAYPGRVDVALHIEPVPPQVAADRLRKQRGRLVSAVRQVSVKGRLCCTV